MPATPDEVAPRLLLCATCDGANPQADRRAVSDALARAGLAQQVQVAMVDCMGACENPGALGLQGAGLAVYVFAGVRMVDDAADIALTCKAWLAAPQGWIGDARSCGRLRDCLRARLPALGTGDRG
jgi:predicted metal-binding protein